MLTSHSWQASNSSWNSSEDLNLASGKVLRINGVEVQQISATQVLGLQVGGSGSGGIVTEDATQTLTNKTLSGGILTGTLSAGGSAGSSGYYLESTGSGVQWSQLSVDASAITNGTSNITAANGGDISVTTAGSLCATFNTSNNLIVTGTVTAQSSIALKDNVETITDALAKVMNLRGVEFDYKANGKHQIGVVAEEVEQVVHVLLMKQTVLSPLHIKTLLLFLLRQSRTLRTRLTN